MILKKNYSNLRKSILFLIITAITCDSATTISCEPKSKFDIKPTFKLGLKESSVGLKLSIDDTPKIKTEEAQPSKIFYGAATLTTAALLTLGCGLKKTDGIYTVRGPAENIVSTWAGFAAAALVADGIDYLKSKPKNNSSHFNEVIQGTKAGITCILALNVGATIGLAGGTVAGSALDVLYANNNAVGVKFLRETGMLAGNIYDSIVPWEKLITETSIPKLCGFSVLKVLGIYAIANTAKEITKHDHID